MGVYANPPKVFLHDGAMSGIFGDLINRIAQQNRWKIVPVKCAWAECLSMLAQGRLDLLPDVAYTTGRAAHFSFGTVMALEDWSQIYAPAQENIKSLVNLSNKAIAVVRHSLQEHDLQRIIKSHAIRGCKLIPVASFRAAFALVQAHKADAAAANSFFGEAYAPSYGLVPSPIYFERAPLYFAASHQAAAVLLPSIDRTLKAWQRNRNSFYYTTLKKWDAVDNGSTLKARLFTLIHYLGAIALALILYASITSLISRRRKLRAQGSEAKLTTLLENLEVMVFFKNLQLEYEYANGAARQLLGLEHESYRGRRAGDIFEAAAAERITQADRDVLSEDKAVRIEYEIGRAADQRRGRMFSSVNYPLHENSGKIRGIVSIATDVTHYKDTEERLREIAYHDGLTGLFNRNYLIYNLTFHGDGQQFGGARFGALFLIDLKNFDAINDTTNHQLGDTILRNVADRIRQLSQPGAICARIGGDVFGVLEINSTEPLTTAALLARGEHFRNALSHQYGGVEYAIEILVNVGAAGISIVDDEVGEVIRKADLALNRAKGEKESVACFDSEIELAFVEQNRRERELRKAIREERFALVFQPQFNRSRRLVGAEALLRLNQDGELASPVDLIEVAERYGLIDRIGHWVLRQTCQFVKENLPRFVEMDLCIGVNCSAVEIMSSAYAEHVESLLREHDVDGRYLTIELTESVFAHEPENVLRNMERLSASGVRFALDDFGCGYSSLSYLHLLPFAKLKVDQSFVRQMFRDERSMAIVKSIIAMGRQIGLEVIAEGVETSAEYAKLLLLGCDAFQGYLWAHPVNATRMAALLAES